MEFIGKNRTKYNVKILKEINKNFYTVQIVSNNNLMGQATFKLNNRNRSVWMYKIFTKPEYQHHGIGQALLEIVEYISSIKNFRYIEGKFYPDNEYAKPFYLKNKYSIEKDGYETLIFKMLDCEKVKIEIQNKIISYEETEINENEQGN